MSFKRCEWRVCGRGQTTPKPFIPNTSSYSLRNCFGSPEKNFRQWNFSGWKMNVCKMKGLIIHPIIWKHLCGILKFFKLYMRGREVRSWGAIRTFRCVRSQSTAEIFLAHNHTGGVHNASATRVRTCWLHNLNLGFVKGVCRVRGNYWMRV